MSAMAPVRLGLVGAGRWGKIFIRTLAGASEVALVALASTNTASRELVSGETRLFNDWRAMLDAGGLDGVIVATPPATHAEIAGAALSAGFPVLIEKPLTINPAEATTLRRQADRSGLPVLVDHIHLFSPAFRRLKALAQDLGPIRAIHGIAGNRGPYRVDTPVLWDWGPHDVAMCLDLLNALPDTANATRLERRPVEGGEAECLLLDLRFGAISADLVIGTTMDKVRRFEVECAGGILVYDDLADDKLTQNGSPIEVDRAQPLDVALAEFAAAIRSRSTRPEDLAMAVSVVEILARCEARLGTADLPEG